MKGFFIMRMYGMKRKQINGTIYFYDRTKIIAQVKIRKRGGIYAKTNKREAV